MMLRVYAENKNYNEIKNKKIKNKKLYTTRILKILIQITAREKYYFQFISDAMYITIFLMLCTLRCFHSVSSNFTRMSCTDCLICTV